MTITVVGAEKGGVGKSTIAVNLAAECARGGADVLLVDTDKMGSAQQWAATRKEAGHTPILTCIGIRGRTLAQEIRLLAAKFDDIIIDAGGHDSVELRSAMLVADVIVTPCEPAQFDIFSMFTMDRLVGEARLSNETLRALMVTNCAPTNPSQKDTLEMLEALEELSYYQLASTVLTYRKAYKRCARDGLAVTEYKGHEADVKAIEELRNLVAEVWP